MAARATTRKLAARATRKSPRRRNSVTWESDDASLVREAETSRSGEELARLHKYAVSHRDAKLKAAVAKRAAQLRIKLSEMKWNPSDKPVYVYPSTRKKGAWSLGIPGYPVETRKSKRGAIAWADRLVKSGAAKEVIVRENPGNPADAAASMSERFHGRPVVEVKEVDEKVHYHTHLAEVGELDRLKIRAMDGAIVKLDGFDGALLCSNEDGSQLYIRGGDQSVDPDTFGVEEPFHDKEELGEVIEIRYFTTKEHLGKEGGEATYFHEFGEEDKEAGRKPRRPRLHYSVRDKRLSFAGGGYRVEDEGIVN